MTDRVKRRASASSSTRWVRRSRRSSTAVTATERSGPVDVLVIGGGGSGLAAAISAADAGARVTVVEAAPVLCGSTGRSVGSIAAAGTPDQRRLWIHDDPEAHAQDYTVLSGALARGENLAVQSRHHQGRDSGAA